jgi:hypothetical protein
MRAAFLPLTLLAFASPALPSPALAATPAAAPPAAGPPAAGPPAAGPPAAGPPPTGVAPAPRPRLSPYAYRVGAPDPAAADGPASRPETRWYGWQILIPGIISHMFAATGSFSFVLPVLIPGLTGSIFSAPIVHWAHGHTARGFASLGIQLGGTGLATGLWVAGLESRHARFFIPGSVLGLSAMATGLALDAALLARDTVGPGIREARREALPFSLAPLVPVPVDQRSGRHEAAPVGLTAAGVF